MIVPRSVSRSAPPLERYSSHPECPEAEELVAMVSGGMSLERRSEISTHASGCAPCRAALDELLGSHAVGEPADPMASTEAIDHEVPETWVDPDEDQTSEYRLSAGDRVNRYVIEPPVPPRSVARRVGRRRAIWGGALVAVVASVAAWPVCRALRAPAAPPKSPPVALAGMIWFAGGTFRMGRTPEELERECKRLGAHCRRELLDREQPGRAVTLSPFCSSAPRVQTRRLAAIPIFVRRARAHASS